MHGAIFCAIIFQALSELVEFMSDPHARCKDHQKLVRNLNVSVEILFTTVASTSNLIELRSYMQLSVQCHQ